MRLPLVRSSIYRTELCWCAYGAFKFKEIFPTAWFEKPIQLPFETTAIPSVAQYDTMLTNLYGDYMTPPPVEERDQRHRMTIITLGEGAGGQP